MTENTNNQWQPYNPENETQSKRRPWRIIAPILGCLALVGILAGLVYGLEYAINNRNSNPGGGYVAGETSKDDKDNVGTDASNPALDVSFADSVQIQTEYTKLYQNCSPSCVSVMSYDSRQTGYSLGSGFVLSEEGYIATNHHVIEGGSTFEVVFYDGKKYDAELIGSDSAADLAVLRIDADNLVPVLFGNSDNLLIGEPVAAIGTPYDITLAGTMTTGTVSGLKREVECTDDYGTVIKTMTLIQIDAPINPGNSGGPLFNLKGQVIGINTLKLINEYEGTGFCIPITDAVKVFEQLIEYGEVPGDTDYVKTSPKLFITVMTVSDAKASAEYGRFIDPNAPDGVYVTEVTPGTAIYEAGLEAFDIITEFNGELIEDRYDLADALAKCKAGDTVDAEIYHRGSYKTITFVLDKAA